MSVLRFIYALLIILLLGSCTLLLVGCASKRGQETAGLHRTVMQAERANTAALSDAKEIKVASGKVDESLDGTRVYLSRADGKAAIILQWLEENRRR